MTAGPKPFAGPKATDDPTALPTRIQPGFHRKGGGSSVFVAQDRPCCHQAWAEHFGRGRPRNDVACTTRDVSGFETRKELNPSNDEFNKNREL